MKRLNHPIARGAMLLALLFTSPLFAAIAVIAHPGVSDVGVTNEELENLYMGRSHSLPSGTEVTPIDQSDGSAIRETFYRRVADKEQSALKAYWSKRMFTGKGKPPRTVEGDEAMLKEVSSTPGAIGYISGDKLNDQVKLLLIIP